MKSKPPIIRRRTLIIGLGGTGSNSVCHLLRDLKQFDVVDQKGDRIQISSHEPLRVLAFDTDDTSRLEGNLSGFKQLLNSFFVPLNQLKIERKLRDLDSGPNETYQTWYPDMNRKHIKSRDARHGVGQWRVLGRLAYVENRTLIEYQIGNAINDLKAYTCEQLDSEDIDIYVIGSLAGGTGSGMMIDVAYYLQRAFVEQDSNVRINTYGYLLLPGVFEMKETGGRTEANSYAAIKEINAFFTQERDFEMFYPDGDFVKMPAGKAIPFTVVFLFDRELSACKNLEGPEEVYEYLGSLIYLKLVSSLAKKARSVFQNAKGLNASADKDGGTLADHGYVFSSCSGALVHFPLDEDVIQYVKEAVFGKILEQISNKIHSVNIKLGNLLEKFFYGEEQKKEFHAAIKIVETISAFVEDSNGLIAKIKSGTSMREVSKNLEELRKRVLAGDGENVKLLHEIEMTIQSLGSSKDYFTYFQEERPQMMAKKAMEILKMEVHKQTDVLNPCLQLEIKKELIKQLERLKKGETSEVVFESEKQQGEYRYEKKGNLAEFYTNMDKVLKVIKQLAQEKSGLRLHKKHLEDLYERFIDFNVVDLLKIKGQEITNITAKFLSEQKRLIYGILVGETGLLAKWQNELIRETQFLEIACKNSEQLIGKLQEEISDKDARYYDPLGHRFLNKIAISPKSLLEDRHNRFIDRIGGEFWIEFSRMVRELDQDKHLGRGNSKEKSQVNGKDVDDPSKLFEIGGVEVDSKYREITRQIVGEFERGILEIKRKVDANEDLLGLLKGHNFSTELLLALRASKIDLFTNVETHSNSKSRVFWSIPAKESAETVFGPKYMEYTENVAGLVKEVFRDTPDTKIEFGTNQFIIYFETHHHPAYNIKGVRKFRERYSRSGFDPGLLHIHKDYATQLKDPIVLHFPPDPVLCGNIGCSFDIGPVPRHIHFCPGCEKAILNRCGNAECTEDRLLNRLGGIRTYFDKRICPSCHEPIQSFLWKCTDQGHGAQLRNPLDKFCPDCNKAAFKGEIAYKDRSRRAKDQIYPIYCKHCVESNVPVKQKLPVPALYFGVPNHQEEYLKAELALNGIKHNNCNQCGSKLYPECPNHLPGEIHFLEMDEDGKLVCTHSDHLHQDALEFYQCHHCDYPVTLGSQHTHKCPRCERELVKCGHCSDRKRYLIDKPSLEGTKGRCPICNYNVESNG